MDRVETPAEMGKRILEQQAQEQMRLQEQIEEEEREERIRLRRLKERQMIAFMTLMKIRMDDEKARREYEQAYYANQKEFFRQQAMQEMLLNKRRLSRLARHHAAVSEFLFADETPEEAEKRDELLQNVSMDREDFSTLTMADMCKKLENTVDVEKVFSGEKPTAGLEVQRRESIGHAENALQDFSKGNIKKMENILKEGLLNACHAFVHTKDTLNAIHWSKQINGVLSIINSHPVLFKDGASTPLLENATGMAALGRVLENGLVAMDEMCAAQLGGVKLTPEREMNLQAQVMLMQQTDMQRSNEQYRKLFARGYHPKRGLQQENLKNLLKQINTSEAMYTLSNMNKEERLFTLTDTESRRILSKSLFEPRVSKKTTITETKAPKAEQKPLPENTVKETGFGTQR